jgi:hypothetical protein
MCKQQQLGGGFSACTCTYTCRPLSTSATTSYSTSTTSSRSSTPINFTTSQEELVVDALPTKRNKRLPALSGKYEFPPSDTFVDKARRRRVATTRILYMATHRVLEPPTLHLLAASACATLGIGLVEGTLLCQEWPFWESLDAGRFALRYSLEQLFPSVVWQTQDPKLVAIALTLDPDVVLQDLSGDTPASANLLLQTGFLASSRSFFAGFMMIAQLVRAAGVSIGAFSEYEQRVQLGKEPPILTPQQQPHGLVARLCGRDSFVTEVSMKTMGVHLFPVFEDPERVQFLVWKHSEDKRRPIYWRVQPGLYGSTYSWDRFPADRACLLQGANSEDRILILEADATNGNDPLSLDEATALDLTIDDTSQGFRRILEQYATNGMVAGRDFRTLRVYLGNSMETATTGGGHSYTLRHRVRYAKEVDVLIDSRAPVLKKILEWCETVVGADRKLFFQTSSREYFLNLKALLKEYGYEILDPLDLRMLHKLRQQEQERGGTSSNGTKKDETNSKSSIFSLMSVLLEDPKFVQEELEDHGTFLEGVFKPKQSEHEMLRTVAKMSKLPRLVHMDTTAATVNAVEALIAAGEVQAGGCCALMDRLEGVQALERTLRQKSQFVESQRHQWTTQPDKEFDELSGLQIICSSSIHDDLFRQVRLWARMGHSATDIQKEIDAQFKEILQQSYNIQREVGNEDGIRDKVKADSGRTKSVEESHVIHVISPEHDDRLPSNQKPST